MVDWKIVAVGIAIVAIVASAIIASGAIKGLEDMLTFPGSIMDGAEKNVSFYSNFSFEALEMEVPASEVTISYNQPNSDIMIDEKKLSTSNASETVLVMEGFNGRISIGEMLGIDGTIDSFEANSVGLGTEERISVMAENLTYNYITITNMNISELSFSNVTGSISADSGKIFIMADNDRVVTGPFTGDLKATPLSIEIDGMTTKIEMPNDNEIIVSQ